MSELWISLHSIWFYWGFIHKWRHAVLAHLWQSTSSPFLRLQCCRHKIIDSPSLAIVHWMKFVLLQIIAKETIGKKNCCCVWHGQTLISANAFFWRNVFAYENCFRYLHSPFTLLHGFATVFILRYPCWVILRQPPPSK